MTAFPPPDATRAEIDAWREANGLYIEHEAPEIRDGPSLMCNACGVVRINIFLGPFCKACQAQIDGAAMFKVKPVSNFPDPNATREEIEKWEREQGARRPTDRCLSCGHSRERHEHEFGTYCASGVCDCKAFVESTMTRAEVIASLTGKP